MTRTRVAAALALTTLAAACFGPDPDAGKPKVTIEFPDAVTTGSTQTLIVEVENPGPEDLSPMVISFTRVGAAGSEGLPAPLIDVGIQGESRSIISVSPAATSVSVDAVVYQFASVAAGETATVEFEILIPNQAGRLANSVIVYDGQDVDRAKGALLETVASE